MQFPGYALQSLFQKRLVGAIRKGCQEMSSDLTTRLVQVSGFLTPLPLQKTHQQHTETTESCQQRTGTADKANKDRTTLNKDGTPPISSQQ